MGILDKYKAQLEEDKKNENVSFPEGSQLKEEHREEYVKVLKELRNNSNDMENTYRAKIDEMKQMSENDMENNNLINNEGYSNATDYINKFFMEEISSKTNMKKFRKEASDLIDILPRDIAIETLQKIRSHLITEINAYSDEIHFRFKGIKNIDDFIDALNLKLSYKLNFKFEDKLKFANKKLNALLKEERASLKKQFD